VASAGRYANHLHLAPDRQPRQRTSSLNFSRTLFLMPNEQCQSTEGKYWHITRVAEIQTQHKHSHSTPGWCCISHMCFIWDDRWNVSHKPTTINRTAANTVVYITRTWANTQRDGRPAEYRWRPLFNAAKFGWRPILKCRAVTLARRETRWNSQGCPKLLDRCQPLVGRSSPYCGDMWRRYCCLRSFFSDCRHVPYLRRYSPTNCAMVPIGGDFLTTFCVLYLQQAACSTFQTCILNSH